MTRRASIALPLRSCDRKPARLPDILKPMFGAVIMGIIQGFTEFLPISSTAHLVLLPWFFKWGNGLDTLTFDVALHAGTLVSLFICFYRDIIEIIKDKRRLILFLIAGTIPAGIAGIAFNDYIETTLRTPVLIAAMLVVFGMVMYLSERFRGQRGVDEMSFMDAVFIGCAQAVALIPGVSRSGVTISAGLFKGLRREEAARFSFLLSMPAIAGAVVLEGRHLINSSGQWDMGLIAAGFISSLITGVIAIKFLMRYLKQYSLNAFVIYRFALAALILGVVWSKA